MALSIREGIELFHIAFLGELGTRLDKARFALKGGCNLRFFFKSPRYSEDLDADIGGVPVTTLQGNVKRVLESKGFRLTLAAAGVELAAASAPKQSETTQRWKLALTIADRPAHTKLDFSRRRLSLGRELGPIDPALVARYGLTPVLTSHYGHSAALQQKYDALRGRTETQARDVFDLDLLLHGEAFPHGSSLVGAATAIDKVLSIDHGRFKSQVVAYLPAHQQELYSDVRLWQDMQQRVVTAIKESAR